MICRSHIMPTMICRSHIMPQAVCFSIYEFVVDRYLSKLWYVEAISCQLWYVEAILCHRLVCFSIYEFVVDRYLSKLWYVEVISCHKLFAFQYIIQICCRSIPILQWSIGQGVGEPISIAKMIGCRPIDSFCLFWSDRLAWARIDTYCVVW